MSDQPDTQTSAWQYKTLTKTDIDAPGGFFEPAIPAGQRQQTHDLERVATGIG